VSTVTPLNFAEIIFEPQPSLDAFGGYFYWFEFPSAILLNASSGKVILIMAILS